MSEADQIDEVERARARVPVCWDGPRVERREQARELAERSLRLAGLSEFQTIACILRVVGELMVEDPDADIMRAIDGPLAELDAICADIAAAHDASRSSVQHALWVRFWVAWDLAEPVDVQVSLLGQIIALDLDASESIANDAQLRRAIELDRAGQTAEAFEDFHALTSRLGEPRSTADPGLLGSVWYEQCLSHCAANRWDETVAASQSVALCYERVPHPPIEFKVQFAEARWMRCIALAEASAASLGTYSVAAWRELEELIDWLRRQREPQLRRLLVMRLATRMVWLSTESSALRVVDEILPLVRDLGDRGLTRYVATEVSQQMPELVVLTVQEEEHARAAVAQHLAREGGALPQQAESNWLGLGESAVSRTELVAAALAEFAVHLRDDTDERAIPALSLVLVNMVMLFARLGRGPDQERGFTELVGLGEAAVEACDKVGADASALATAGTVVPTMVSMRMLKASLLQGMGRVPSALDELSEVVEEFRRCPDPLIVAMVKQAQILRDELRLSSPR